MQKQEVKYPSQFVKLPSKGLLYPLDSPYSNGQIQLRYPTAQDQNILTSRPLMQKGKTIDIFIQNLIVNPLINIDDLTIGDMDKLIISSRILAYGNKYQTKVKCANCGKSSQKVYDLNAIPEKIVDHDKHQPGVNQFYITLPVSKKNIVFKILTNGQDNQIKNVIKNQKSINGVDNELTTRLQYSILSVDGETDKIVIINFIRKMPAKDSLALRSYIRQVTPDIDLTVHYQCETCGYEQQIKMSLNVDFFYPSR